MSHRCPSEKSFWHSYLPKLQLRIIFVSASWTYQGLFNLHIFSQIRSLYISLPCILTLIFSLLFPLFLILLSLSSPSIPLSCPSCPVLSAAQSEDKVKPVRVVPGHLHALEHVVRQDYFPKENVAVLEAFLSR